MFIMSQDEKTIVNSDNVAAICVGECDFDGTVFASFPVICDGECALETLGKYSSQERAIGVIKEICDKTHSGTSIFVMPRDDGKPKNCDSCERGECPYAQLGDRYRPRECDFYYSEIPF